MNDDRAALADLLRERSLREGKFTLSSGLLSDYYIDARTTTFSGRGQLLIGRLGLAALDRAGWSPDATGGLTLGADPVACAIAHAAALAGRRLDAFTVRKAPKGHGAGRRLEGGLPDGARVVVIEDTITTGSSALEAAAVLRDGGFTILGVLALIDREEGGRERITGAGYALESIYTAAELRRQGTSPRTRPTP